MAPDEGSPDRGREDRRTDPRLARAMGRRDRRTPRAFRREGLPERVGRRSISLGGRIVSVADAYDTMTAARSYKKPMAVWAARRELADCAGGQFDPEIVRAFLSISLPKLLWRTGPVSLAAQLPFLGRLQEVGLQSVTAMTQGVAAATVAAGVTAMVVTGTTGASAHGHHPADSLTTVPTRRAPSRFPVTHGARSPGPVVRHRHRASPRRNQRHRRPRHAIPPKIPFPRLGRAHPRPSRRNPGTQSPLPCRLRRLVRHLHRRRGPHLRRCPCRCHPRSRFRPRVCRPSRSRAFRRSHSRASRRCLGPPCRRSRSLGRSICSRFPRSTRGTSRRTEPPPTR